MNIIRNDYKYVLKDRFGTIDVQPLNEKDFTIEHEIDDDGKYFYSKQFGGKLTFNGVIFERLRNIEKSIYICTEQQLEIYRKCEMGNTLIFEGNFRLSDGSWDDDNCQVELSFSKTTLDKCLTKNKSQKVNLLNEVFPKVVVKTTTAGGVFEYKTCHKTEHINSPSQQYGLQVWCSNGVATYDTNDAYDNNWVIYDNYANMDGSIGVSPDPNDPSFGGLLSITTMWVREVIDVNCNDVAPPEWVLIQDTCATGGVKKYAKQATLYDCNDQSNYTDEWNYTQKYSCKVLGSTNSYSQFDNGILVNEVLKMFVLRYCPSLQVVSDFFQINPTIRKNLLKNADLTNNADGYYSWFYNPIGAAINGATTYNSASKSIRLDITSGSGQHPSTGIGCLIDASVLDFTQIKNKTITISYDVKTSSPRNVYPSAYSYQGFTIINQNTVSANNGTYKRVFVTVKMNNVNYSDLYFYAFSENVWNSGDWLEFKNFKLEIGDTATEFQPNNIVTNYVTGQRTQTDNLILFQKSDVKRPNVSGNAWKAEWSFEKLIEALNTIFNVSYAIVGNTFRLEHISWFTRNAGLNLTLPRYERYVNGFKKYTYKVEDIPSSEIWQYKETNQSWIADVDYANACAIGQDNTEKKYILDEITADVQLCISNPDKDSNVVEDKGFVIMATTKFNNEYYIITESEGTGGSPSLNNTLGFHRLVKKYHFHNRPLKSGKFNGTDVTFITTKPLKKGEKISVPLCCNDNFDPSDTIKTPLGIGVVDKATFNLASKTIDLDLLYNVFENLTNNEPPVITGATLNCYTDSFILFPINASDVDGVIVSVQIAYPAGHGIVEILSTTQGKYTPTNGYIGTDFFHLKAFDDWAEVSNIAPFMVNVLPANQPPVAVNDNYNVFHGYPFTATPSIFDNDSDDNGFTLQTLNVVTTQGVSVSIDPTTGNFSYTPPANYEGVDSFQYTIVDNAGLTSTATVFLTVGYKNKPIAVYDHYNTLKNVQLITDGSVGKEYLFANDYTPDGLTYTYTCTAESKPTTQGGTVIINTNGTFTYNPPANFVGVDSFDYTVHNINGQGVGTAFIHVLPTIYVQFIQDDFKFQPNIIYCGDPPQAELGGQTQTRDFKVKFWADAAKTIPYDVTGLNFNVNIREVTTNNPPYTYTSDWQTGALSGTESVIYDDYLVYSEIFDCNYINSDTMQINVTLQNGNYIIVT